MPSAMDTIAAPPTRDRAAPLRRTARIALAVAGAAALYRVVVVVLSNVLDGPTRLRLLVLYGTIALAAFALRWGVNRRASVARWASVIAGLLMAAALLRGRGAFAAFWHYFPMPALDVFLFLVWPAMIVSFVVAGSCCALARSDTAGWR